MKKFAIVACLVAFGLASLSACAHKSIRHGTEISEKEAAQLVDGKTTKDEVYLMFGEPKKILEDGNVFVYNWVRGAKTTFLIFGSGSAYGRSLIVTFDDRNLVKSHRITRGDVQQGASVGD